MNPNEQGADPNQQQQQAPQFDPNMMAQVAAQAAAAAVREQNRPDPNAEPDFQSMTREQRAEYLKEFTPDDDFVAAFATAFRPNDDGQIDANAAKTALTRLRDGFTAQAVRTAELMLKKERQEMEQQFLPAVQLVRQQSADKIWNDFTTNYPGLKPFKTVVDAVANAIQPAPGMSREQILDAIAQQAEAMLKQANPGFSAKGNGHAAPQQNFGGYPQSPQQFPSPSGGGFTPATASPGYPPRQTSQRQNNPFYDAEVF